MVKKVEEKSMKYGYCRVSTKGQAREGNGLEAQERAVREVGAAKIYLDSFTGVKTSRPELDKLLQEIQSGDTLIITKIDRIARTATQGWAVTREPPGLWGMWRMKRCASSGWKHTVCSMDFGDAGA